MNTETVDTVVVTGAAKGLGLRIAETLIEAGFNVIGVGRTVSLDFNALPSSKRQFIEYDLTNIREIPALVTEILKLSPNTPYALINNAGTGLDGSLVKQHASNISRILTLNLEAPITLTKYVVRHMMTKRRGRVVNISSIIVQTGFSGLSVYGSNKGWVRRFYEIIVMRSWKGRHYGQLCCARLHAN